MNVKLKANQKIKVNGATGVAGVMQQILQRENKFGRGQEHLWVVGLNSAGKILFIELIALGRQNRVNANPPDVFRIAIYKLAVQIILVHNHPSGNVSATEADRRMTDRMIKVGEIINVDVTDHIIISETAHYSFADHGIMDVLRASDSWRLNENDGPEMRKFRQELEKERAEQNAKMEIARNLKVKGMDEATIKEVTGLRLTDIRKIKVKK